MRCFLAPLAALALALPAAAATPPAKPAPKAPAAAKPAPPAKPAAPAAKPAAPKPAAGPFDARNPASLIALLETMDAQATINHTTDNEVFLKVEAPSFVFNAQFANCDSKGANCQGLAFSATSASGHTTLAQLNDFNQTSITCRVFQDSSGRPHVMYSTLLFPSDTRDDMRNHIGAWQGCLQTFGVFLSDPIGYLADAP